MTDPRLTIAAAVVHRLVAGGVDACWKCKGNPEQDPPCPVDAEDIQIAEEVLAAIDAAGFTTATGLISVEDAAAARGVKPSSLRQMFARTRGPAMLRALTVEDFNAWTAEHPPSPYHARRRLTT